MVGKEQERRVLISTGERLLCKKMPEQVRSDSYALRIWNILDEKAGLMIRVGTGGTDEEVHQLFSAL